MLPVLAAIAVFVLLALGYFSPVLDGKRLVQGDIRQFKGMSEEIVEHRAAYGEEPLWTESMFAGMPAYQISVRWSAEVLSFLDRMFHGFLPNPAGFLFLYLIGMFILLRCLRVDAWLCVVGAIAFAFSSYFIVILEAGHNTKAEAVGYMPMVLGGLYVLLRGEKWTGAALFALFLTLMIHVNHVQVAYYLGMLLVLFGLAEAWRAVREKHVAGFLGRVALAGVGVAFAVLCNLGSLWSTYEYGKYTTRGPSELTITPEGGSAMDDRTSGLDKSYVTRWSYGKQESFSLLVPNVKGGASGSLINSREDLDALPDPAFRNEVMKKYQAGDYINSYWGDQDFTSGPTYVGAIVVLLLLLMLARAEGPARWWVLGAVPLIAVLLNVSSPVLAGLLTIAYLVAGLFLWKDTLAYALYSALLLTLMLSWGHNYMPLTDFFLDHVPGYDKFRAVTIILVIVELCAPVLAVLYLDRLMQEGAWDAAMRRRFLWVSGGLALLLLVMAVAPAGLFDFFSDAEKEQLAADGAQSYVDGLKAARVAVFTADAWRSLLFVLAAAGLVFAFGRRSIGKPVLVGGLGLLVLIDMWSVDKRFINNEQVNGRYRNWEDATVNRFPFKPGAADLAILRAEQNAATEADLEASLQRLKEEKARSGAANRLVTKEEEAMERFASLRRTTHFRVLEFGDPFNSARASYFHKSLGGYHGAKLKRYQELISFHLVREMRELGAGLRNVRSQAQADSVLAQQGVLNMLNTRYLIVSGENPPLRNGAAFGVGWFVDEVRPVKDADEEITLLGTIDPRRTALVDQRYVHDLDPAQAHADSTATVRLKSYKANDISYTVNSAKGGVAVFSEIWYGPDWVAEIDGAPAPYVRADYVLRAMSVPAGEHTVRFRIESRTFTVGGRIARISSWVLLLGVLAALGLALRPRKEAAAAE